ncbi:MAG: AtpZ/AtpI family protein [Vicingaceae bacterium]|nr:AtpZ/AtpI family protein [Vicingaceae bacterium]
MEQKKKSTKKRQQYNTYLKFSGIAIQMGAIIGLGSWAGHLLDEKYKTSKPYFTLILALLSIAIALYLVIKEVVSIGKEDDTDKK